MVSRTTFHRLVMALLVGILGNSVSANAQQTPPSAYTSSVKVNYIRTVAVSAPESVPNNIDSRPLKDVKQTTQYFDGLGRPLQTVLKQSSLETGTSPVDIAYPTVYDEYGRELYTYLPFAANNTGSNTSISDGNFKLNPFQQQATFYSNQLVGQSETYFYGKTDYENSPLNRVIKSYAPGNSWVGNNRGVETKTWTNTTSDSIKIWAVTDIANDWGTYATAGWYQAGDLLKLVTKNENGKQVIEFKNKAGSLIAKKEQLTTSNDDGSGLGYYGWLTTYYVYDNLDNLRLVIQPRGVELLLANAWNINALSGDILKEQCYRYEYDSRKRMRRSKAPGAVDLYMIYDQWDRIVLTQDSNQRAQNKWMFTKYDQLNRPVMSGIYNNTTYTTQSSMQTYLNTQNMARYENYSPGGALPMYSMSQSFPVVSYSDVLEVTYYDDYDWVNNVPSSFRTFDNGYNGYFYTPNNNNYPYAQPIAATANTQGLITGVIHKVLDGSSAMVTTSFYDDQERVIQTKAENYQGGCDITTYQYAFDGKVLQTMLRHQYPTSNYVTSFLFTNFYYDDLGRVTSIKKNVAATTGAYYTGTGDVYTTTTEYDKLGHLKKKTVGNNLETMNFDYNIRGWMLGVNREFIRDYASNKFGFELGYDKAGTIVSGANYSNPQFNGNIGGLIWKSIGDNQKRKYDFTYDAVNRLTGADFNQWTSGSTFNKSAGVDFSVNGLSYDANGNILFMKQVGWKPEGSATIDSLTYNYYTNSNRLKNVVDGTNDVNTKLGDFRSSSAYMYALGGTKTNSANDYTYDANGNLTIDNNKDITSITYNILNLPEIIQINGKGSVQYWYDAAGVKLKKQVVDWTQNPHKVTNYMYVAGYEYKNDELQAVAHQDGSIRYTKRYYTNGDSAYKFVFDYFLKDYLGNVRMVLTEQQDTAKYLATMEAPYRATENALFYNIQQSSFSQLSVPGGYPTDPNQTSPHDSLIRLNGSAQKIGPAIVLKVMSGDRFEIGVTSFYKSGGSGGSNNNPLNDILGSLATGIISAVGDIKGTLPTLDNSSTSPLLFGLNSYMTGRDTTGTTKPRAYLNWILLDEQLNYISGSSQSGAIRVGNPDGLNTLSSSPTITRNGFLYVYLSNETQNWDVFFDNLSIKHYTGPILEETHYYPFGLTMAGISSKAIGKVENKFKFNGGSRLENKEFSDGGGLEWYSTEFRTYDPQIGRLLQIDPLGEVAANISPYAFALNNPVLLNDPLGLMPDSLPPVVVTPHRPKTTGTIVTCSGCNGPRPDPTVSPAFVIPPLPAVPPGSAPLLELVTSAAETGAETGAAVEGASIFAPAAAGLTVIFVLIPNTPDHWDEGEYVQRWKYQFPSGKLPPTIPSPRPTPSPKSKPKAAPEPYLWPGHGNDRGNFNPHFVYEFYFTPKATDPNPSPVLKYGITDWASNGTDRPERQLPRLIATYGKSVKYRIVRATQNRDQALLEEARLVSEHITRYGRNPREQTRP